MNRTDFINLLEAKIQVDRRILGEVYELIELFPYFQSAHLLLLKGLKDASDVKFERQLRLSSIHVADRDVLYYLLNGTQSYKEPVGKEVEIPEAISQPEPTSPPEEVIEVVPADKPVEEEPAEIPLSLTEVSDQTQTVIDSAKNSEQMISEIEKDEAYMSQSQEFLQQHSHSILVSSEQEFSESDEVMVVMDEEVTESEEKIYYMDPGFALPDNNELLEIEQDELQQAEEYDEEEEIELEPLTRKPDNKQLSQAELIDNFIFANPRIEPVRDQIKVPAEDISKSFTENSGGFVTETLANIYISQGYFSKAVEIYEKLCLKFPEKSSYFATQIELIKEHLKK
jgi:tetratricopeptide (TPR) repeat protein